MIKPKNIESVGIVLQGCFSKLKLYSMLYNKYRLVVRIVFEYKAIQIKWFGTHKEYDAIDVSTIQFKRKK